MKSIWKFTLDVTKYQTIEIPKGAELLTVQIQNERPQLWAIADPNETMVQVSLVTIGTGHTLPHVPLKHVGTYQMSDGAFVGHVFVDDFTHVIKDTP